MNVATLTLKLDVDLKEKAEKYFISCGLSLDSAVLMFLQNSVKEQETLAFSNKNISFLADEKIQDISEKIINNNIELYKKLAE